MEKRGLGINGNKTERQECNHEGQILLFWSAEEGDRKRSEHEDPNSPFVNLKKRGARLWGSLSHGVAPRAERGVPDSQAVNP